MAIKMERENRERGVLIVIIIVTRRQVLRAHTFDNTWAVWVQWPPGSCPCGKSNAPVSEPLRGRDDPSILPAPVGGMILCILQWYFSIWHHFSFSFYKVWSQSFKLQFLFSIHNLFSSSLYIVFLRSFQLFFKQYFHHFNFPSTVNNCQSSTFNPSYT